MSDSKERGIDSVVSFGGHQYVHWHTYENVQAELKAAREDYKWLRRNYDENKMLVTDYTAMKAERDRLKNLLEMSEQTRKADADQRDRYKAALEDIRDIAFDGDGLATAEDLGKDIAELAKAALSGNDRASVFRDLFGSSSSNRACDRRCDV